MLNRQSDEFVGENWKTMENLFRFPPTQSISLQEPADTIAGLMLGGAPCLEIGSHRGRISMRSSIHVSSYPMMIKDVSLQAFVRIIISNNK